MTGKKKVQIHRNLLRAMAGVLSAFLVLLSFPGLIIGNYAQGATLTSDAGVTNTASFSTDVIYQIVTDRFLDGNTGNNPTGAILTKPTCRNIMGVTGQVLPKN